MIPDADVLRGIPQRALLSLPTEEEKLTLRSPEQDHNISEVRETKKVTAISEQPELLALDPDRVLETLKKERHIRRKI